jgi:hypothetical protein
MTDDEIRQVIRDKQSPEGDLFCVSAFQIVEALGVVPLAVGQTADEIGVKLSRCQLGLFGYGPKAQGRHKIVGPADDVAPDLAQAIRRRKQERGLSCKAAWEIAASLGIPKMQVASAAEALEVKIVHCQLGAF